MIDLHQELMRIINSKTPSEELPVDMLMNILSMKKEAAYRRLRGDIPFTLEEAARIATYLNISFDQLLQLPSDNVYKASLLQMNNSNSFQTYCQTIRTIIQKLQMLSSDPEGVIVSATNMLTTTHLFKYPALSKFRLFKFLYQYRAETIPHKMAEVVIPPEVRQLEETWSEEVQHVPIRCLWPKEMLVPFIDDVCYFRDTGLISKEEVELIKKDCFLLLDELERDSMNGHMHTGKSFTVYISEVNIDTSYLIMHCRQFRACTLSVFGVNYFMFSEPALCDEMMGWINSMTKYAVLISESGRGERFDFFNRQRAIIENTI